MGVAPVRFGPLRLLLNQGFYLKVHVTVSQRGSGREVNASQPTQSSAAAPAHAAMHAIQARALDLLQPFKDVRHVLAEAVVQHHDKHAQMSATAVSRRAYRSLLSLTAETAATCDASSSSMGTGFLPNKPPPVFPAKDNVKSPTAILHLNAALTCSGVGLCLFHRGFHLDLVVGGVLQITQSLFTIGHVSRGGGGVGDW